LEFDWGHSNTLLAFFGAKRDTNRFVWIPDGTNTLETFSGAAGDFEMKDLYANGTVNSTVVYSHDTLTLHATGGVRIPSAVHVPVVNVNDSTISSTTDGTLVLNSGGSQSVWSPNGILIGNGESSSSSSSSITSEFNGLVLASNSAVKFSTGILQVPTSSVLTFDGTTGNNNVYSDGEYLYLNGFLGTVIDGNTVFNGNVNIVGSLTATAVSFDYNDYILPLGTFQVLNVTLATTGSLIESVQLTVTESHNLVVGDSVLLKNIDTVPPINGQYTVSSIVSSTQFEVTVTGISITSPGSGGTVKSVLTRPQNKEVGIQVNYWSTTGNTGLTAGTAGFKTGFFGFDHTVERWVYYTQCTISNNNVTGTLGDIGVGKVYASRISGFVLDGAVSCGTNSVSGTAFAIGGGSVNNTPIGTVTPRSGVFTALSNTVSASLNAVSLQSSLVYSTVDKYVLSSTGTQFRSPSANTVLSLFSVSGVYYTASSGTMPSTSVPEGTFKIVTCNGMGTGCEYTLHFGTGKLLTPMMPGTHASPSKIVFKQASQCAQLLFDGTQWILLSGGVYCM
jgi:hypothetical protein